MKPDSIFNSAMCSPEEYNDSVVPTTHKSQLLRPKADPHLQEAGERVQATAEELERLVAWGAGNEKHSGRHLSAEIAARPARRSTIRQPPRFATATGAAEDSSRCPMNGQRRLPSADLHLASLPLISDATLPDTLATC